jgi:prohibitin 2
MASQGRQAINRLGGMLPKGGGKGLFTGAGTLIILGAAGLGINASLFNGILNVYVLEV